MDLRALFQSYKPALVRITVQTPVDDLSTGTVFHIGDGWLVTAAHVLRDGVGLRRWTWKDQKKTPNSTAQKWAVENKYHFQNFVCAVLAPVLPDLRDEEWLASVGQKKTKADLMVPSLHLVIEVKYLRNKSTPQDLISQIGEDVSLHLKRGSPYRKVLPIIWDQGRRTEQYDLLITGLIEICDMVSPVVIAQPAFMV